MEENQKDNLEAGLSHILLGVSNNLAYVKLSVDFLPALEELASHGIFVSNKQINVDSLRRDVGKIRGIERLVNDYNNILDCTENHRKVIFNDLIEFGDYLSKDYDQMLALAQFCEMIKFSGGSIDYSMYGGEATPAAKKQVMGALRQQEIRELRFWMGAIGKDDPLYKLLGTNIPIEEFREIIKRQKPELNGQRVVKLDTFKGDYELIAVLGFKTNQGENCCVVQATDKKAEIGSRVRLYAVGEKSPAAWIPTTVFQDATLTQLAFYENEMSRIAFVRQRDGF